MIHLDTFTFHYVSIKSLIADEEQRLELYLHSTMFLLNPILSIYRLAKKGFTFHYVSIKSNASTSLLSSAVRFTFHYVSIKSQKLRWETFLHKLFTFHYVSIKSQLARRNNRVVHNLHSTMFLLNLEKGV